MTDDTETLDAPAPDEHTAPEPEAQADAGGDGAKGPTEKAAPTPAEKDKPEREPWFVKRIAELTRQNNDRDRALQQAEQRLREFQPAPTPPPAPDLHTLAEQRAQAIVAERTFNLACNAAHAEGVKAFPDFAEKMTALGQAGGLPPALIEAALDTEAAPQVLYALGQDPELAMRIRDMSPSRMGVALAKLAASPPPVAVSKAPAPLRAIGGGSVKSNDDPEKMSMSEFSAWRAKQTKAKT